MRYGMLGGRNQCRSQEYRGYLWHSTLRSGRQWTSASNAANPATASERPRPLWTNSIHLGAAKVRTAAEHGVPGSDDTSLLDVFASPTFSQTAGQFDCKYRGAGKRAQYSFPAIAAVILGIIGLVGSTSMNGVGTQGVDWYTIAGAGF